jgi:long-chain acyl-CoA synthetase
MTNLANGLVDAARAHDGRPALRLGDTKVSFAEVDDASARVATMLRDRGFHPGDRVGIMLPNVTSFPPIYYGVLRAGGVVVPMNPLLKSREVAFYLGDSGAQWIFAFTGFADEASKGAAETGAETVVVTPGEFEQTLAAVMPDTQVIEREPEDTAVILYTSGTTGKPKGAELAHANLSKNAEVTAGPSILGLTADDVIFGGLPMFHSFGQTCALNASVQKGACVTLLPRFDPASALETLQRDRVTIFEGVPTMYAALLQYPQHADYDTSALRLCISGGAAMPVEILRGFEDAFGCIILEGYGLSETSPVASFNQRDRERKAGSIGTPIEGVDFRLVDDDFADMPEGQVGEIAIKGHNVMKGYWNRPEASVEAIRDGWFRTGDMARRDEDGYYFIVDRKKDLIIRGGFNVYPREIEEVLYEHPAVAAAAVIGVPHPTHGEEVAAAVQLLPGASLTPEELREYTKQQVAAYKYPRHIWFVDALPMGPTGKILKREIVPPPELGLS